MALTTDRKKVIALCGYQKNGKDTAARVIINQLITSAISAARFGFGDEVKREVCNAYNVTLIELEANKDFWRQVLQFWAHDYRRVYQQSPMYWIDKLHKDLQIYFKHNKEPNTCAIIADCRYPDEFKFLKENYNASFLWIERPICLKPLVVGMTHASENSIISKMCDATIQNTKDIKHLDNEVYCALRALRII